MPRQCNMHPYRKYLRVNLINFDAADHLKNSMEGKTEHYLQLLFDPGQGERGYIYIYI